MMDLSVADPVVKPMWRLYSNSLHVAATVLKEKFKSSQDGIVNDREWIVLGRYRRFSPRGREDQPANCSPLGAKRALSVGMLALGGSRLSWLGRGLGSPRSLTGIIVPEKPILRVRREGLP